MAEEITAPTQENKQPTLMESVLGQRIDTKAMVYAPTNEMGVIFLAGFLWDRLGISHIEEMHGNGFPDAIGVTNSGTDNKDVLIYKRIRIEFEYVASNFKLHGHPVDQCDLIICWENDWKDCPIKIIELKDRVKGYYQRKSEKNEYADNITDSLYALYRDSSWVDGFKEFEGAWEKLKGRIV